MICLVLFYHIYFLSLIGFTNLCIILELFSLIIQREKRFPKMKIIVDADASPVKKEIISIAQKFSLPVVLVMSIAHHSFEKLPDHVKTIYVEKGADRADFKIVQLAKEGDIVVTQDYGLASLLLPKKCRVIHHLAYEYTNQNINRLLEQRHFSAIERNAGYRTKGPRTFTKENRDQFRVFFEEWLIKNFNLKK